MKSSAGVVLIVAVLVPLFAPGPAAGGSADQLRVNIRSFPDGSAKYRGKVTSPSQACVEHRTVKVISHGFRLVKTRTDSVGKFKAIGRSPARGSKVTVIVPAEGSCLKLVGTGRAS